MRTAFLLTVTSVAAIARAQSLVPEILVAGRKHQRMRKTRAVQRDGVAHPEVAVGASVFVRKVKISNFCLADFDGNGVVDAADVSAYLAALAAGDMRADYVPDGTLNVPDFVAFAAAWSDPSGPPP